MLAQLLAGTTEENNQLLLPAGQLTIDMERMAVRLHDGETLGGFEILGQRAYEPGTGPGPQELLAGDSSAGFYGEVPVEELIDGAALALETGLSAGTPINTTEPWLKFAYQGKTLFIAKKPYRHSLNWEDLYRAGLVYGTDDFGTNPLTNPVTQRKVIEVGSEQYIVRLPRGGDTDPTDTIGGEWADLLYRVWDSSGSGDWYNYTSTDIMVNSQTGLGQVSWCQETYTGHPTYRLRLLNSNWEIREVYNYVRRSDYGWRPVLELVG